MSNEAKFLVTSATGNTGYQVAIQLLEKGENVRVMSRSYGVIIKELESKGAEVVVGNISKRNDMEKALSGINRVYYCYPIVPKLLASTKMLIEIAKQENIETVVNLGQYLAELESHPSKQTNEHRLAYKELDDASIGAIHVTPGWFADNLMNTALFISQFGRVPFPLGKGRSPIVSNEDIAAVVVSLLREPQGHEGKRFQPTGPKSLSMNEMMQTFEKVLGRKVKQLPMPRFLFNKAIIQMGFPEYLLSQLNFYVDDFQNGEFDYEPNDVVLQLTGRNPESFDVTAKRYFEKDNLMKRSSSGVWKAFKQFMMIGFTKAPGSKALEKMNLKSY